MATNPRSPKPPRRPVGWAWRGLLMASLGVAAYYGLELGDRLLMERLGGVYDRSAPLPVVEIAPRGAIASAEAPSKRLPADREGNPWVRSAIDALAQHDSITAQVSQLGWINGQAVQMRGDYRQLGADERRRFALRLQGELADSPTRLLRVSNSRFLWTDLAWGEDRSNLSRSVTRLDLRRVRRAERSSEPTDATPAGNASRPPADWSRLGGLPMLLAGLEEAFDFGKARRMQLRGDRVVALVGRRSQGRSSASQDATERPDPDLPDHVVVALSESTLFPMLVEYRSGRDPLSADGLPDEALLQPSRRPLLKIDLANARFGDRLPPSAFDYRPGELDWQDVTDRELRIVQARRERRARLAGASAPTRG